MTDPEATTDLPSSASPNLPKRPGLWRAISLLAVAGALVIATLSVLQARDASNVAVPDRSPVALEPTTITASGLALTEGTQVAVLGLPDAESRRELDAAGTLIDLPKGMATVVSVTNSDDAIIGLAVVTPDQDRSMIQVSPRSTANALLVLSPGVLRSNLAETFVNVRVVESDPAFEKLVDAIAVNSNISIDNDGVEQAYAEIADRLPIKRPPADQGCDSVAARNAYPGAGTCVQPQETGLLITNEQDRWAVVFQDVLGVPEVCALIAPTKQAGDEVLIPSEQCVGEARLAAPGPAVDLRVDQELIDGQVRIASAVNVLYDFAGPFADLAGGSAGFAAESVSHIRRNATSVTDSLALLIADSEEFAAAMDVTRISSTALDRHVASVAATRLIVKAADTTALIPQRSPGDTGHVDILDFFVRAGERMTSPRTDWRWLADASDTVDFGGGQ